ncbi:MAG: aldo/keto reductase [Kiritimatiellia bacterium]|jgi:predicted aldo/keto reductase-like oxidoreductase
MPPVIPPAFSAPLHRNDETMRYRKLGSTGWEISALAMGCMRLSPDQELDTNLVARAVELGVNYFETTRHYIGGTCQHKTAPGIAKSGKAADLIVSGKEGLDPNKTAYLFRKEIERQLDILGLSHFKFFQVGWFSWAMMPHLLKPGGVLDAIRQAKREGLVQHVGFTGHDSPENFIRCIETGLFDCITVPYNMINRSYEPTIRRAGELGVGVIAMCSVAGGVLATKSEVLQKAMGMDMPTAAMALRFVLSNPDVSAACSGMSTMEMLEENVKTAHDFDPSKADHAAMCEGLDRLRETLGNRFCTGCRYCQPCPKGVDIPRLMELHRNWKCFGLADAARDTLAHFPPGQAFSNCSDCGACEAKCPNELPIRDMLRELHAL